MLLFLAALALGAHSRPDKVTHLKAQIEHCQRQLAAVQETGTPCSLVWSRVRVRFADVDTLERTTDPVWLHREKDRPYVTADIEKLRRRIWECQAELDRLTRPDADVGVSPER